MHKQWEPLRTTPALRLTAPCLPGPCAWALHLGPEELLVAAKISAGEGETGEQIAEAITAAEQRIRSAVPIARIIYWEPDVYAPRTVQAPADSSGPASR